VALTEVRPTRAPLPVRGAIFAGSVALVGFGVALMVESDLGVSPNDVTNTGLAEQTGWSVGLCAWLLASFVTVLAWVLGRRATIATLLASLGVGVGINLALSILPTPDALPGRVAMCVAGLVVLWIAITGIVATDVGAGPIELLMLALTDRRMSIHVARWLIEAVLLVVGALLGGSVGVGTAAFAFGTGPVLAVTIPWSTRRLGVDLRQSPEIGAAGP
jgi:uncharacterized membrane protein YczE